MLFFLKTLLTLSSIYISTISNVNANDSDDFPERNYFDKHYMRLVEIEDFNALIDKKSFFVQPVKTNKKHMKNYL